MFLRAVTLQIFRLLGCSLVIAYRSHFANKSRNFREGKPLSSSLRYQTADQNHTPCPDSPTAPIFISFPIGKIGLSHWVEKSILTFSDYRGSENILLIDTVWIRFPGKSPMEISSGRYSRKIILKLLLSNNLGNTACLTLSWKVIIYVSIIKLHRSPIKRNKF